MPGVPHKKTSDGNVEYPGARSPDLNPENSYLSLKNLRHTPFPSLAEGLRRAKQVISDRTGIISQVQFEDLQPGGPAVFLANSTPADISSHSGYRTLNFGSGASIDPDRAAMKAIGESIERYASAHIDETELLKSAHREINETKVDPMDFALFSPAQYARPGFRFSPPAPDTTLHWKQGYSLTLDQPIWIPAQFIYVPYLCRDDEPLIFTPISTGLACGPNLPAAIYRGILEVIERDAFMIVWQNRLPCPDLDLKGTNNPNIQKLIKIIKGMPVQCQLKLLTLDILVPVILVLLTGSPDRPPHTVVAMAADCNPENALIRALEEAILTWLSMARYCRETTEYERDPEYKQVFVPMMHSVVHAMEPELQESTKFMTRCDKTLTMSDLPDNFSEDTVDNIKRLVDIFNRNNLQIHVADVTTVDIDDAGFKVVRSVIPGMQPLDLGHSEQYLGGKRLYEVPCRMGLFDKPLKEEEFNPFPHPFP